MSAEQLTPSCLEFVEIARREGLLADDSAAELTRESQDRQMPPAQVAMQRGLLSLVQVEIVETLLNPLSAIAGYEVLGLLGYGGMGVVYRARQKSLGRIVALKTVMLNSKTSRTRLSRFELEAQTVGKLLHPQIITAYDFGRDGNRLYFAMELVDGEDVERRLNRDGPFTEEETWGLLRQAAAGLAQAAKLGVVHRDIKPANLLLVAPPTGFPLPPGMPMVKIADFGLALITNEVDDRTRLTADNSTVGTPHYMAPEQLSSSEIDLRADIYALGATAYHMLAGQPPFEGLTLVQIFSQKLNQDPVALAMLRTGLSLETITLVQDLMARDPARRIGNYTDLIDRIDQLGLATSMVSSVGSFTPREAISRPTLIFSTETRHASGATQTSQTSEIPLDTPLAASIGKRIFEMGWRGFAALVLLGSVGAGMIVWRQTSLASARRAGIELKPSGYAAELFDGESLAKWQTLAGNWQTATDDEGATVLAASHGLIFRAVVKEHAGRPPERIDHYRLRFNAALRQAKAIELSFGIHTTVPNEEARSVLRMEHNRVSLGRQSAKTLPIMPVVPPVTLALNREKYQEMRIERQAAKWHAYVDDQWIGTVPLTDGEAPLFRIAVEADSDDQFAYLADFLVEELVSP